MTTNKSPDRPTKPEKSYPAMDDAELAAALSQWESYVENAAGWPSAYFAAKQVEGIVAVANRRGLGFVNRFPIKVG